MPKNGSSITPKVKRSRHAGGHATEAGMSFQADVGLWFAARMLSGRPVGTRFGLPSDTTATAFRFETGESLDDLEVTLAGGGALLLQCKTRPSLSASHDSDLGSTIAQLVHHEFSTRGDEDPATLDRTVAVLAVRADAPRSLDALEESCRYLDHGEAWNEALERLPAPGRHALTLFASHARAAYAACSSDAPSDADLASLARRFRIERFDVEGHGADKRAVVELLATYFVSDEPAALRTASVLGVFVRALIKSGASVDRPGLVRELRARGVEDTRAPGFDQDIARVRAFSEREVLRLTRHRLLSIDSGIELERDCVSELDAALEGGSLFVVGEPGVGKTGILVTLAERREKRGGPLVLLSVDRLSGIGSADDIRGELGLGHGLLEVLLAWPGRARGTLIVDALDATRGGRAESVFAAFLEDALTRLADRWSILVSIRTFDLASGARFRSLMKGAPPVAPHADPSLERVRHFRVPPLSEQEVADAVTAHPALGHLLDLAPEALRGLLRNVFNLSLVVGMVEQGVSAHRLSEIASQSELLERYEDVRLGSGPLKRAVAATVAVMIARRRLVVPRIRIEHDALEDVLSAGVLVAVGDRVAFVHHVLFDHVAARFHLDWDDPERLTEQLLEVENAGLLLGPALRFAVERLWRDDDSRRRRTWGWIFGASGDAAADPVVVATALRTVVERVTGPEDVETLREQLRRPDDRATLGAILSSLARFVSLGLDRSDHVPDAVVDAWTAVALEALGTEDRRLLDGAVVLLRALERNIGVDPERLPASFGQAARALLRLALVSDPPIRPVVSNAIRLVCRSFATDPAASRASLLPLFDEPHFSAHAHEEVTWLAESVPVIAKADPDFALCIYTILFERSAPQDGQDWFSGHASSILPLTADRRQSYEHARWHLVKAFPKVLEIAPEIATRATTAAAIGERKTHESVSSDDATHECRSAEEEPSIVEDHLSLQEWSFDDKHGDHAPSMLGDYARLLRDCPTDLFRALIDSALEHETASSVWARILAVGARRHGDADDLLRPVAKAGVLIRALDTLRGTVAYLAAAHPDQTRDERVDLEQQLLSRADEADGDDEIRNLDVLSRFLSTVDPNALALDESRVRRQELTEHDGGGNPPLIGEIECRWVEERSEADRADRYLTLSGVDLEREPDRRLRDSTRPFDAFQGECLTDLDVQEVATLWTGIQRIVTTLDAVKDDEPHPVSLKDAESRVGALVVAITKTETYDPECADHPDLPSLLVVIDRLRRSPYPESALESNGGSIGWSNYDIRVYAAQASMSLARAYGGRETSLIERLPSFLDDAVPAVRVQIIRVLDGLMRVDQAAMWTMVEHVAEKEEHSTLMPTFVGGSLRRLSHRHPERCETIIGTIMEERLTNRPDVVGLERGEGLDQACAGVVATLWIEQGRTRAGQWVDGWVADLVANEDRLTALMQTLRLALFFRYLSDDEEEAGMHERAQDVVKDVVDAAAQLRSRARATLEDADVAANEREEAIPRYRTSGALLDEACLQLLAGVKARADDSGAEGGDEPGQSLHTSPNGVSRFLTDYGAVLHTIGEAGDVATTYKLVQLYERLASGDPERVFDRVWRLLSMSPSAEAFRLDSLGADALVELVRRYLADHRIVFDDTLRRERLTDVLRTFSDAGWPAALELLHDLPELLR